MGVGEKSRDAAGVRPELPVGHPAQGEIATQPECRPLHRHGLGCQVHDPIRISGVHGFPIVSVMRELEAKWGSQ